MNGQCPDKIWTILKFACYIAEYKKNIQLNWIKRYYRAKKNK